MGNIRKVIYTTNAIESMQRYPQGNQQAQTFPRMTLDHLPSHHGCLEEMDQRNWKPVLNRFMIEFEERPMLTLTELFTVPKVKADTS